MDILGAVLSVIAVVGNIAVAIWCGPRAAARLSVRLHQQQRERDDKHGLQRRIFVTLMQERATPDSADAIKAFNLIDTAFADDPIVRHAWARLLGDRQPGAGPCTDRKDLLRALLAHMALALGLEHHLSALDFERIYAPDESLDAATDRRSQDDGLLLLMPQFRHRNP